MPPRHLPFALILMQALRLPSVPLADHLRYAPHRHHRTSPSLPPLALICISASRESGVLSYAWKNPQAELPRTRQRFYRASGSLRGGVLHIPRGREGARRKQATARWGVCKATTGASPRNPQLPHSSVVPSRNPLQIARFCRTGPARDGKFACKSNFYDLI